MSQDITRIKDIFNGPAPGANVDIFGSAADVTGSDLEPAEGVTIFRVQFSPATSTILNVMETRSDTQIAGGLNRSVEIAAGDVELFDVLVSEASTYNMQVETDTVINQLKIAELRGTV